ncbi:L,D-transpeptidase family protein [Halopseudomonas salina]|uniref:Peptidoglycan-binding protein n=1 Tax=Halopseudomonas salina TaxID=1323744 RepID=A0ABQ1PGC1_9GAMM|nr:L,D-transpeptidase family protein [Halopseudomonas salina]GGC96628.1 peptidoglycan-binding protein [Halopseudomonas salina]
MLKICTVLFVASLGPATSAVAASQDDIARLLSRHISIEQSGNSVDNPAAHPAEPEVQPPARALSDTCPHLAHLRTADIATGLAHLYQHNDFAPLWEDQSQLAILHQELEKLADDGLTADDYPFHRQVTSPLDTCAELRLSSEYLLALEHLGTGRLDQQTHEPMWRRTNIEEETPAIIRWTRDGLSDVTAAFDQARPDLDLYLNLRSAYIRLRDESPEYARIPTGELIRPGGQDPRVPLLAERLRAADYLEEPEPVDPTPLGDTGPETQQNQPATADQTLNTALEQALKHFQSDHGLKADGVLGPNTLTALNMTTRERLDIARINLERLRWINALLQDDVLLVNSARNELRHYQQGKVSWQTTVITGRPGRETPSMVSQVNRITLNPDWTVPPTIRKQDMIPEIRKDLGYLERKNLIVIDYQGNRLDPQSIDWYDPRGLMLRQPPGPDNPLGQVVFRFDNPHAIYLHDTPNRHLFSRVQRNLSSGCVRVEGADALADMLFRRLSDSRRAQVGRLQASSKTHQVGIDNGPQVVLSYWTAEADQDGRLLLSPDPYGKDLALITALARG